MEVVVMEVVAMEMGMEVVIEARTEIHFLYTSVHPSTHSPLYSTPAITHSLASQ